MSLLLWLAVSTAAMGVVAGCGGDSSSGPDPVDDTVASVTVTPPSATLGAVGATTQLSASAKNAGGSTLSGVTFVWSTSDASVAGVSGTGLVAAMANGSATVSAMASGTSVSGTSAITVQQTVATVAQVTVSPAGFDLQLGETLQLQASARDASGSILTGRTVAWSSIDANVATVSAAGLVTGTGGGTTTIAATVEGVTDGVSGSVLPYRVVEGAFAVDSTVLELVSNRADMDAGTYRFQYLGAGAPTSPTVGDVIVGTQGLGFLRKVTAVSVAGSEVTVETDQALLGDLIDEGEFGFNVDLFTGGPAGGPARVGPSSDPIPGLGPDRVQVRYGDMWTRAPEGVSVSGSGYGINFKGFDVCKFFKDNDPSNACPSLIDEFKFPNGTISFSPSFDFGATKNGAGEYTEFHGIATGEFSTNISVSLGAKLSTSITRTATIFEFGRIIYLQVGALPVVVHAEMEIKGTFEASASVKGRLEAGIQTQHTVDVGATWDDQQGWQGVLTGSGSFTPLQPSIDDSTAVASINLNAKVTLTPNLNLKFYGIAGPLVGLEPWAKAELTASTSTCGFDSTAGVDAKVGIALADFLTSALSNPNFSTSTNLVTMQGVQWLCPVGDADVITSTAGSDLDPDGYTIEIAGEDEGPIAVSATKFFGNLREGTREVALKGLADNCEVQGANPVATTITIGQKATVNFQVTCRGTSGDPGTAGSLDVSTSTSGSLIDPDGYQIAVDGNARAVGVNETVTFAALTPGSHTVVISGLAANCSTGSATQSPTVVVDASVQVTFIVACAGGEINVTTTTSGTAPANTTMSLSVDGVPRGPIDFNDQKTFGVVDGQHDVGLTGVPTGCVAGVTTMQVNVPDAGSAPAAFQLDCPAGLLTVTASTEGDNGGQNTYRVVVDGTNSRTVNKDGSVVFTGLSAGAHTLEMLDVPAGCTLLGQNPRTVTVPGVAAMDVNCSGQVGEIAYVRGAMLLKARPDGTNVTLIQTSAGAWPSWSPANDRIVVSSGGLRLISVSSGSVTPLTTGRDENPDWGADSTVIAFTRELTGDDRFRQLLIVNPYTGAERAVTQQTDSIDAAAPSVSPTGPAIAFSGIPSDSLAREDFEAINIYRIGTSGGAPVRLTNNAVGTESWNPSYSPDGTEIAYVEERFTVGEPWVWASTSIRVITAAGGSPRTIYELQQQSAAGVRVSWSPGGEKLVVSENGVIVSVNIDGSDRTELGVIGDEATWSR